MTSMGTLGLEKVMVEGMVAVGREVPDHSILCFIKVGSGLKYTTKDTGNTG